MLLSKLHVSAMLLGPLLLGAGSAGVAWATLGGRVSAVEVAHSETKARVDKVESKTAEHDTGIAVLNTKVDAIKDGVDRLESKLGTK